MDYNKLYNLPATAPQPAPESVVMDLPDTDDIVTLARYCAALSIKALVSIMQTGKSDAARVAAANALLDRGYGKPGQSVTVYQGAAERKAAWADVQGMFEQGNGVVIDV